MWSLGFMRAATLCNMAIDRSLPGIRRVYGEEINESQVRDAIGAGRIMDEQIKIGQELTNISIFEQDSLIIDRLSIRIPLMYSESVSGGRK